MAMNQTTSQLPRIPSDQADKTMRPASEESPKPLEANRSMSTRGRKSNNKGPNQKKVPQRGMGVFQLEVLRVQETLKKMHQSSSSSSPSPLFPLMPLPPPFLHSPTPVTFNGGVFPGSGHLGWVVNNMADSYGFGAPVLENSKELSSMPNAHYFQSQSHHCDVCLKKKRFNEDSRGKGFDIWTPPMMNNGHDFLGFNPTTDVHHEVEFAEVVAVHRKGSSRNGKVLMEYGFFPGKDDGIRSTTSKELRFSTLGHTEPSPIPAASASASALGDRDTTATPTSVDLSLKLSY